MGEYAKYKGEQIKIGTCEDMYYLRWDQRHLVTLEAGSLNPADPEMHSEIRFRFPFPQEDQTEPGQYDNPFKGVAISGAEARQEVDHGTVQMVAQAGYLCSIPCPEGPGPHPLKIARNGFNGAVLLVQQAVRGGVLAPVFQCGGCEAKWSEPDRRECLPYLDKLAEQAEYYTRSLRDDSGARFYLEIAKRILAGYDVKVASRV